MSNLSSQINSRENNLNFLRLLLAFGVLHSHSYALFTGKPETEPFRSSFGFSLGGACVDCFFFISGLLVTNSLLRRNSPIDFLVSRFLRVFPAAAFAAFMTVFFLGPYFTEVGLMEYIKSKETYIHLLKNSTIVFGAHFELPGLFHNNPYPNAVNGSLWTLPYEVRLYLAVIFIWWVAKLISLRISIKIGHIATFFALASIGASFYHIVNDIAPPAHLKLIAMFSIGATFACYSHRAPITAYPAIALIFACASAPLTAPGLTKVAWILLMPLSVIYLAYSIRIPFISGQHESDYSYGLYIYAFPIQQAVMSTGECNSASALTLISTAFALPLAVLSWHLIEKPSMSAKMATIDYSKKFLNSFKESKK